MNNGQIRPVDYSPSKKPLYIITFLLVLLLIGIGVIITLLLGKNRQSEVKIQPTPLPTITVILQDNQSTSSSNIKKDEEFKYIIYTRENNIWSVRSDGTQLRQLTRDGDGTSITYPSYMFLGNNVLVFIRCVISESSCWVIERNLTTDVQTPGVQISSLITNFAQSTDNNPVYAYITSGNEATSNLVIKVENNKVKVIEFAGGLGRGGSLSDEQSLQFSKDNKYILVVNTGTQPNAENNKTTIWIVDRNGNMVDKVSGEFATNAIWEKDNTILYLDSGNLYRKAIRSQPILLGSVGGYDIDLSVDGKTLIYWNTLDDGTTTIYTYTLADNKTQELVSNISSAKWVTSNSIAGRSTTKSTESMFGFELNGLIGYSIPNNKSTTLDSNSSIWNFIVSP